MYYTKLEQSIRKSKKDFYLLDPQPDLQKNDSPDLFMSGLSYLDRKILQVMIYYSCKFHLVFPSQELIASEAGCCRATVNRRLQGLEDLGLMVSSYNHMHTKEYRLSTWFLIPWVKEQVQEWLPCLKKMTLNVIKNLSEIFNNEVLSKVRPNPSFHDEVTQLIFKEFIYNNFSYFFRQSNEIRQSTENKPKQNINLLLHRQSSVQIDTTCKMTQRQRKRGEGGFRAIGEIVVDVDKGW